MRHPVKNRNIRVADYKFQSLDVAQLVNYVMLDGKKTIAEAVVYDCLDIIKEKAKVENPSEVLKAAIQTAGPVIEVRSRRVGGANYQVPREIREERRRFLALRWIIATARNAKGRPMAEKLADEIIGASKGEGEAIKKRDNMHKMAEANKAFAHFAF
jgi:small subunit ribosomal protein S7